MASKVTSRADMEIAVSEMRARQRDDGMLADLSKRGPSVEPIGIVRVKCVCTELPCTDCLGLGYVDEPVFPTSAQGGQ